MSEKKKIVFITGGSKGIGLGLVKAYFKAGYEVYSIARSKIDVSKIEVVDFEKFSAVKQISFDLSQTEAIPAFMDKLLQEQELHLTEQERIVWINNAGNLGEMAALQNVSAESLVNTVNLNLIAPMLCARAFLKHTQFIQADKKIINISSGAAQSPYHGWAAYCATKAGLDMLTQTLALEQDSLEYGANVWSIYPGVVDTDMQGLIRQQNEKDFKSLDRFIQLKENNELYDPERVGQAILELDLTDLPNGHITRVNLA